MTKKRHWPVLLSKPQSTAPHSLESSGRQSNVHHDEPQSRNVNDMLANLRRRDLSSSSGPGGDSSSNRASSSSPALGGASVPVPSVPPELAHLLLPSPPNGGGFGGFGVPGPGPAVGLRGGGVGTVRTARDAAGGTRRRGPAGPAPPPSWETQSRAEKMRQARDTDQRHGSSRRPRHAGRAMLGLSWPKHNSLVDVVMGHFIASWEVQREQNMHELIYYPGHLRALMVSELGRRTEMDETVSGATIKDLRVLLTHPSPAPSPQGSPGRGIGQENTDSDESDVDDDDSEELLSPTTLNEDFRFLDLTWSVGHSISVRDVSNLLFPRQPAQARWARDALGRHGKNSKNDKNAEHAEVLDSWDAPEGLASPPRPLLPHLTHLSLALFPGRDGAAPTVSWRHLLSLAKHLPMLTHLSLAYWPEPTFTPNAKLATVASPMGQRLQYGGINAYSHTLDNDWAEAVHILSRLSKALYGLEYLDLTGCAAWLPALMQRVDNAHVDWVGDWGKVTTLVLDYGVSMNADAGNADAVPQPTGGGVPGGGEMMRQINATSEAHLIEEHIRQQRAGQGRFITVVYDRHDAAGSRRS